MDLKELSLEELIEEYRQVSEFRGIEKSVGQVSIREIRLQEALEDELISRVS